MVGKTFSIPQLMGRWGFDAVFVGAGAGAPSFLGIPGEFAGQVYSANEFLTRVNLMGGDKFPYLDTPITLGKSVVVIGAGNTAMDCLRVAKRLGTPTVRCVYRRSEAEAPARIEELRHAKEEGIEFFFLHAPVEILVDGDGNVRGMKVAEDDARRARREGAPQADPAGRVRRARVRHGDLRARHARPTRSSPSRRRASNSTSGATSSPTTTTQATSVPGVFAGGDIVTGGATVILAMGAGRRAARAIGAYLASGKSKWPITQADADAFVPPTADRRRPGRPSTTRHRRGQAMNICPRCHRPLEGDESYICCAGMELRWRCTECHKVAEGFAFPYGLCPYCKGQLEMLDRGAIEDDRALEAVRKAFEIELGGHAFYQRAARDAKDPGAAGSVRPLRRDGAGAHGNAVEALPRGRCPRRRPTSRSTAPRSSPASTASRRIRPTCSASRSRSRSARSSSSRAKASARPQVRSSATCTANWPPRSASTSRC